MYRSAYTAFLTLCQHIEDKKTYTPWNTVPYWHMYVTQQGSREPWGIPGDLVLIAGGRTSHLNPGRKKHITDFTGPARTSTDSFWCPSWMHIHNSSASIYLPRSCSKASTPFSLPLWILIFSLRMLNDLQNILQALPIFRKPLHMFTKIN